MLYESALPCISSQPCDQWCHNGSLKSAIVGILYHENVQMLELSTSLIICLLFGLKVIEKTIMLIQMNSVMSAAQKVEKYPFSVWIYYLVLLVSSQVTDESTRFPDGHLCCFSFILLITAHIIQPLCRNHTVLSVTSKGWEQIWQNSIKAFWENQLALKTLQWSFCDYFVNCVLHVLYISKIHSTLTMCIMQICKNACGCKNTYIIFRLVC